MEGDSTSDGGNRGFGLEGVGEGNTRLRSLRTRKPRSALAANLTETTREKTSNDAEVEGRRHHSSDAMDASEVESGRGGASTIADALWGNARGGANEQSTSEGKNAGAEEGTEVSELSGWRNMRRHPPMRWVRSARAPVSESSDGSSLGRLTGLLDSGAQASEGSGSRDRGVHNPSAVIGFSSDEEDAVVNGKKPVHDVIDLAGDSPVPRSVRNEEAGPSHSSGESPPRRVMQRPASADAKRARRIVNRSTVAHPEERTVEDGLITLEDPEPPGDIAAPALPEPYDLRRGRSLNVGAPTLNRLDRRALTINNGIRGRLRRHRFQPGGSAGGGLSDVNTLRRPFSVPSSSRNGNTDAQRNPVVNLEDQDSPTLVAVRPANTIVLEDEGDSERARQLADDERVARELQDSFALEDQPPTDEALARMLQAEENSHGRGIPIEQRPVFFAPTGMRSLLGSDEDEREAQRLFRTELLQGPLTDNVASSSRIVRRGYGRNSALSRTLNALSAPTPDTMNARRVQFPARMGLESRMEFLAALEMALEQYPVGLQLAHVDRDFNENDYEMLLALDTDNHRHRGASMESIMQLPVTTVAPTDVIDEDCSICLETPKAGDVLRRLPCMHAFHQPCIDQWLQHQAVCPVCKAHINTNNS